jgi:hypothetical protein
LNQFWNTGGAINLGITTVGFNLNLLQSDGTDIWAADNTAVQRLRGGDGRVLETWTGTNSAYGVLVSMGRVFASGQSNPGKLYRIEPAQPAGAVTTVATNLGANPAMMALRRLANLDGQPRCPWFRVLRHADGVLAMDGDDRDGIHRGGRDPL